MAITKLKIENYRRNFPYLFLIAVAILVLYPLFLGQFYAVGDMRDVFIPLEQFFHQEQLAGHIPSWHPDIAWGFPVIAAAQIGFFYPLLLVVRWLPVHVYLPVILVIHVLALLMGIFRFLKSYPLSTQAALFGALSFGASAYVWQHLTHLNIFLAVAWLPWQLWWIRRSPVQKLSVRSAVPMALLLGLPFTIGQLQIPLLMAAFSALFFLFEQSKAITPWLRSLRHIALVAVLALGLSAVQLLPTLELLQYSSRSSSGDFSLARANQHSFPLYHLPTLLFPRFFGADDTYWGKRLEIEYGIFVGTLPLLLALWQLFHRWRKRTSPGRETAFWALVVAVSFLLALGAQSPFRLLGLEPSLWFFSAPARWLLFTSLGLSVLAAFGFDQLLAQRHALKRLATTVGLVLAVGVLGANCLLLFAPQLLNTILEYAQQVHPLFFANREPNYYLEKIAQLVVSLRETSISLASPFTYLPFIVLAGLVVTQKRIQQRLGHYIIGATAIELLVFAATTTPFYSWRTIFDTPASVALLPTEVRTKQARLLSRYDGGDTGAFLTNPSTRANDTVRRQQQSLLLPLMHTYFDMAGVSWPASLDLKGQAGLLDQLHGGAIDFDAAAALNIGALAAPRTYSIARAPSAEVGDVAIYQLDAVPRATVTDLTDDQRLVGQASYTAISPTQVRIATVASQESRLIIRDTMYPGWVATVDGQRQPLAAYRDAFQSLYLPPGAHRIQLNYQPRLLYIGMSISSAVFLASVILLVLPPMLRLRHAR